MQWAHHMQYAALISGLSIIRFNVGGFPAFRGETGACAQVKPFLPPRRLSRTPLRSLLCGVKTLAGIPCAIDGESLGEGNLQPSPGETPGT